jgi:hypothetical protein
MGDVEYIVLVTEGHTDRRDEQIQLAYGLGYVRRMVYTLGIWQMS